MTKLLLILIVGLFLDQTDARVNRHLPRGYIGFGSAGARGGGVSRPWGSWPRVSGCSAAGGSIFDYEAIESWLFDDDNHFHHVQSASLLDAASCITRSS